MSVNRGTKRTHSGYPEPNKRSRLASDTGSPRAASPSDIPDGAAIPLSILTIQPTSVPSPDIAASASTIQNPVVAIDTTGSAASDSNSEAVFCAAAPVPASVSNSNPASVLDLAVNSDEIPDSDPTFITDSTSPVVSGDTPGIVERDPTPGQARKNVQGGDTSSNEDRPQNEVQIFQGHGQGPSQLPFSAEFFPGANADIKGTVINNAGNFNIFNVHKGHDQDRYHDPCMKNTRMSVIQQVDMWMFDDLNSSNVLWLLGAPGAGKSAIAESIRSKLVDDSRCYLAFFAFRRTDVATSNPTGLWRTLAFQLGKHCPEYASQVLQHAQLPNFADQFEKLIKQLLQS
ncbi:hypothetical protein AX16_009771, partial [Volvariella volvacea WC 439]